ncbi:Capping Protein Inhibiting Regulator Of Actin Dynamics [Manis pentadactyla]|nr:Capping Protein Inhibiting Regulator Of Actin Dynamics [Manis pentadactyla]
MSEVPSVLWVVFVSSVQSVTHASCVSDVLVDLIFGVVGCAVHAVAASCMVFSVVEGVWCIICVKYVCHVCRAYCVALVFCMVVSCGMQCDITTLLWHIIHVVCGVIVFCVSCWNASGVISVCFVRVNVVWFCVLCVLSRCLCYFACVLHAVSGSMSMAVCVVIFVCVVMYAVCDVVVYELLKITSVRMSSRVRISFFSSGAQSWAVLRSSTLMASLDDEVPSTSEKRAPRGTGSKRNCSCIAAQAGDSSTGPEQQKQVASAELRPHIGPWAFTVFHLPPACAPMHHPHVIGEEMETSNTKIHARVLVAALLFVLWKQYLEEEARSGWAADSCGQQVEELQALVW